MNQKVLNNIIYGLIGLLAVSSFYFIYLFGVNVPHWDDHAIRVFVDRFSWAKIGDIFNFHNEHRIVLTRVLALKVDWLFGHLDFKALMYLGQLALIGLVFWYWFLSRDLGVQRVFLLIITLFIFNFSTYENSLWGMAAIQNHWVAFWSVSSLLILVFQNAEFKYPRIAFLASVFCSVMAMLTSGNGILVGFIGLALLFFLGNKKQLLYWIGIHVLLLTLYFVGLESSQSSGRPHIEDFFLSLFTLLGSLFYPFLNKYIPIKIFQGLGLINLLLSFWVFGKLLFKPNNNKMVLSFLALQAFFFGTLILVSIGRTDINAYVLLSSKYKLYSFLILGTNFFYGFGSFEHVLAKRKLEIGLLIFSGFLFLNAQFSNWDSVKNMRSERIADLYNLKMITSEKSKSSYKAPNMVIEPYLESTSSILDASKVDSIALDNEFVSFFEKEMADQRYIWLKSRNRQQLVSMQENGEARLSLLNFESGIYEVYLLMVSDEETVLYNADKTIRIDGVKYIEKPKNW